MNKLKTGDEVIVIAGRDKGKRGKIESFIGDRVVVAGVNMVKKHVKPNPQKGITGGIVSKEASIHKSNISIFNTKSDKADKVKITIADSGDKVRVFKSDGSMVD